MQSQQFGNEHVLVFDTGEKVLETLNTYLTQRNITGAKFTAIGGFSQVQLEYFNVQTKQDEHRDFNEQVEVISLIGNVALVGGKPYVHAHVSVGTRDYQAHDGHLGEATVQPTLELFLTDLTGDLTREENRNTGLEALQPLRERASTVWYGNRTLGGAYVLEQHGQSRAGSRQGGRTGSGSEHSRSLQTTGGGD